jgi:ERCC4-type nuclease
MEAQAISPEAAIDVLLTIPGMKLQDCLTLQQALGGLSNIAQASVDDILRFTSLGRQKANALSDFFVEDTSLLV